MTSISELIKETDKSTRQALWFYELCKLGVVRFSLSNEEHVKILADFINQVSSYNTDNYKDEPRPVQLEMKMNHQLAYLILIQLLNHLQA